MDKNKIIMWVAILGGGYLIYKYLVDNGILDGLFSPAIAAGTGNGANPPAGTAGGTENPAAGAHGSAPSPAPSPAPATPPVAQDLTTAQKVAQAAGPGAKLSADGWNWHWSNQSGIAQTADLFPPENRGYLMSLDEYIGRRTVAGLSGLGYAMNAFDTPNSWIV
jgi:hypothetical protein